jgi:hypothetical protein
MSSSLLLPGYFVDHLLSIWKTGQPRLLFLFAQSPRRMRHMRRRTQTTSTTERWWRSSLFAQSPPRRMRNMSRTTPPPPPRKMVVVVKSREECKTKTTVCNSIAPQYEVQTGTKTLSQSSFLIIIIFLVVVKATRSTPAVSVLGDSHRIDTLRFQTCFILLTSFFFRQ